MTMSEGYRTLFMIPISPTAAQVSWTRTSFSPLVWSFSPLSSAAFALSLSLSLSLSISPGVQ